LGIYNGAVISELPNPYDLTTLNSDSSNFVTLLPSGLGLILPTGAKSPVRTWTRGGLTSLVGNDVYTGKIISRYDLEFACDVAKGQEYMIGIIHDTNLDTL
jgi:hypothetical protein